MIGWVNTGRCSSRSTWLKEDEKGSSDYDIDHCWKGKSSRKKKLQEEYIMHDRMMKMIVLLTLTSAPNLVMVWRCSLRYKRDRKSWVTDIGLWKNSTAHECSRHLKIMMPWILILFARTRSGSPQAKTSRNKGGCVTHMSDDHSLSIYLDRYIPSLRIARATWNGYIS